MIESDWPGNYEHVKDYLKSDEEVIEDKEDRSYLDWYENWKKENFNDEEYN